MSNEQMETADGDIKLNAAGLMLMEMLVLLALVVQLSAGREADGGSNTDSDIPLVRRYHIDVVLFRRDSSAGQIAQLHDILFTSADRIRWQFLVDGNPIDEAKEIQNQSSELIENERVEVQISYQKDFIPVRGFVKSDLRKATKVGIDIEIKEGQTLRSIDLLFAAKSKPIPAGRECQAFWNEVSKKFDDRQSDSRKPQPPLMVVPEVKDNNSYTRHEWSKSRFTDLQTGSSLYFLAPDVQLIPKSMDPNCADPPFCPNHNSHFLIMDTFPGSREWRDSIFKGINNLKEADSAGRIDTCLILKNVSYDLASVSFYYRLAVQFPDSEETSTPMPTANFLPTLNVPGRLKFEEGNP